MDTAIKDNRLNPPYLPIPKGYILFICTFGVNLCSKTEDGITCIGIDGLWNRVQKVDCDLTATAGKSETTNACNP